MQHRTTVGVDTGADRTRLRAIPNLELIRVDGIEQSIRGTKSVPKPFTLDNSLLDGTDFLAPDLSHELATLLPGKSNTAWKDRAHLLGAHHAGCDYFVTTDKTDLIRDGKREILEALLGLRIRTIDEFEAEFAPI